MNGERFEEEKARRPSRTGKKIALAQKVNKGEREEKKGNKNKMKKVKNC